MDFVGILGSIAAYAIVVLTTSILVVFGYRLLLHPLRAYPGPLAAKLSDAYNGYFSFRKRLHLTSMEDHSTYGPVIRHGPNKLLFNSSRALHAINERSMRVFEPTMGEQIDLFIKLLFLSSKGSTPVNVTERVTYLACDLIALLSLGFPLRLQTDATYRFMIPGMFRANHLANTRMQWFRLHQLRLFSLLTYFTNDTRERYKRLMEKMIKSRLAEEKNVRHDLFSIVSEASSNGESIRVSDIWTEAMSFFPAGAFSTSAGICALFFYLSHNRRCYERLSNEIRKSFTSASEIKSGPQLSNCHYLRACIDEALRIAPPVPGTLWRELASDEKDKPLIIDGHLVPPHTQVGVNIYTLHHNEKYFPDPYTFRPERWLSSETPESQRNLMREAFTPFSIGYRGCAGKAMAYLESSLVVAKTLWYFDFKLAPGQLGEVGGGAPGRTDSRGRRDEYQLYDVIAGEHDGPYLVFTPRDDTCKGLQVDGLAFQ
ncbi:hypothetical protein DL767_000216 [Monosporascus sp. MG133]|nr:hypothetical protein DL767_000216 [Monosporascus sp. MG133]